MSTHKKKEAVNQFTKTSEQERKSWQRKTTGSGKWGEIEDEKKQVGAST